MADHITDKAVTAPVDFKPSADQLQEFFRGSPFTSGTEYADNLAGWVNATWDGDVLTLSFEPDEDMTVPTGDVSVAHQYRLAPLAAALPVLNTTTGEHVHTAACEHQRVSTEVIGADECHHCGPHLDGLCPNACPVAEDEARAAFEAASLRSEIADRIERYANSLVVSARMDDLIGTAEAAARNPIKSDLLEFAASLRGEQGE